MKTKKLNLGCGNDIKKGYMNLDVVKIKGVDKVHNLEKFPYPFKPNTFTEIVCHHILEHLSNLPRVIEELWRISKNKAIIKIISPYALGPIYIGDPSHKTPICYRTFENYNINNPNIERYLTNFKSKARFKILERRIIFSEHAKIGNTRILKFMDYIINISPRIYERLFCYILPSEMIYIELEVVK